jgi:hypothetical protein
MQFWWGKSEDHLGHLGVHARIISKWVFEKIGKGGVE